MTGRADAEERFMARVADLDWQTGDQRDNLRLLDGWLADVAAECSRAPLVHAGLLPDHPLAARAADLDRQLGDLVPAWLLRQVGLDATRAVADALERRAIFLVFGKFNAGKSSLCNFIADRFLAHGRAVEYFRIDAGRIVVTQQRFREGATETTSALQGVFLGNTLVLLDTPGLHSVTPENAALARRFTDSADGVLWMTSSASPGQVQELDELARELRRAKPLLPVVSRSDYLEEDEIDGEIVKVMRNKSPEVRGLQEADVGSRGREKLVSMGVDADLMRSPVSVSVRAALRESTLQDSGLADFWRAFSSVVAPALEYRQRKAAETILHHADEQVMGDLLVRVIPALDALMAEACLEKLSIEHRMAAIRKKVWRIVVPALPEIMERHALSADWKAVRNETSILLAHALDNEMHAALAHYVVAADTGGFDIMAGGEETHEALESAIDIILARAAKRTIDQCLEIIDSFETSVLGLKDRIHVFQHELKNIENRVRNPLKETTT